MNELLYEKTLDNSIFISVLNALDDPIIIIKSETICFANKAAIEFFSYEEDDAMIACNILDYLSSDELRSIIGQDKKINGKKIVKNTLNFCLDLSLESIDDDFIILRLISGCHTDKKPCTKEIKKIRSNLRVTQEKLLSQEKMAGIGQLATGIVHEIFNPLGFVMSNFSTLKIYFEDIRKMLEAIDLKNEINKKEILDLKSKFDIEFMLGDLDDLFEDVEEGMGRINSIISNLKKFSRQETDEFIEYDINDGIRSSLIVARNEYKYIADIITNLNDLPYTSANASKINQVLLNLIVNATHAIKEKKLDEKGIITINTFADNKFIVCEVIDNGIGMNGDIHKKIFEPFYTTKPIGLGTGLGLSISYDIISKQHNGYIVVESEEGKGSKFTIKIPILELTENCDNL